MGEIAKTDEQICEEALQAVISASAKQQVDESMEMVQEVNTGQVDPVIQMDPVVYRYMLSDDRIQVMADARAWL